MKIRTILLLLSGVLFSLVSIQAVQADDTAPVRGDWIRIGDGVWYTMYGVPNTDNGAKVYLRVEGSTVSFEVTGECLESKEHEGASWTHGERTTPYTQCAGDPVGLSVSDFEERLKPFPTEAEAALKRYNEEDEIGPALYADQ